MKVAILGGKSLLDIVFLNNLSEEIPNLNIECYSDSGEVSFGSRRLKIQNIGSLCIDQFDVIINMSNNYFFLLENIKKHNENSVKKIRYFNRFEGDLLLTSNNRKAMSNLVLLPEFGVEPICRAISLIKNLKSLNIVMNQPVAELGKEGMSRFYKEIKESSFRVIQNSEEKVEDTLAFNISFSYPGDQNPVEFQDSLEEARVKKQIQTVFHGPIMINQARVPVNKAGCSVITFESNKKINESTLKNKFEAAGFLYGRYGFSSILVENDQSIYMTKLKNQENLYSFVLFYDSIQRYLINLIDFFCINN